MKELHYDFHFNLNEWSILISIFLGFLLVILLPRRFTKKTMSIYLMCGVFFGFIFDHTLSILPVRYYIINDSSSFEIMDFFSHVMYAPISYLFFYLYDLFNIKPHFTLLYILGWALVSIAIERVCGMIGIFHYQHGYTIYYSFVIYLLVISIWVIFYRLIKEHGEKQY
ncbi:hypothetical protein C2I06_20045 [Niallia circulans]|uniref:hypothetical protein n=1 Tax=Niallia circulans TaxID=1397 RepID=UPI000F447D8A|nr:hypothetical protein [Niallia circulans]AYV68957.1 hypothetical protein C2I06_20045 [Niallia circulans]